jgi:hypothetical protein
VVLPADDDRLGHRVFANNGHSNVTDCRTPADADDGRVREAKIRGEDITRCKCLQNLVGPSHSTTTCDWIIFRRVASQLLSIASIPESCILTRSCSSARRAKWSHACPESVQRLEPVSAQQMGQPAPDGFRCRSIDGRGRTPRSILGLALLELDLLRLARIS